MRLHRHKASGRTVSLSSYHGWNQTKSTCNCTALWGLPQQRYVHGPFFQVTHNLSPYLDLSQMQMFSKSVLHRSSSLRLISGANFLKIIILIIKSKVFSINTMHTTAGLTTSGRLQWGRWHLWVNLRIPCCALSLVVNCTQKESRKGGGVCRCPNLTIKQYQLTSHKRGDLARRYVRKCLHLHHDQPQWCKNSNYRHRERGLYRFYACWFCGFLLDHYLNFNLSLSASRWVFLSHSMRAGFYNK